MVQQRQYNTIQYNMLKTNTDTIW